LTNSADVQDTLVNEAAPAKEQTESCFFRLLRTLRRMPLKISFTSVILLIPCFWLPHIEAAGDLGSHIYNVWLVQQIKQGHAPGLWIAPQSTNIFFDLMLDWLVSKVGVAAAQRIAVSISVLIFFWGAFALVAAMARRLPWFVTPFLAILSYGTMFNGGMFNYYLAAGLSLAALAILWRATVLDVIVALILLALGWLGQPVPVVWAVTVFGYVSLARFLTDRLRLWLLLVSILALLGMRHFILVHWASVWNWRQLIHATGADQSFTLGHHYRFVTLAVWGIWIAGLVHLERTLGLMRMLARIPVQVYMLCLLGPCLLPGTIYFPAFKAFAASGLPQSIVFGAIEIRLGWLAGVLICALLAQVENAVWCARAGIAVALVYFAFLYQDHRAMNKIEKQVEGLVSTLPAESRVVARLYYPTPVDGSDQSTILDRACIGRCISFANYEPATGEFRVRAKPGNSLVAWAVDSSSPNHFYSRVMEFFSIRPNGVLYYIYTCGNRATDVCMQSVTLSDNSVLKQ
jgi:hypothetical protein